MCVELKKTHFANGIESKWTRAHKSENETEKNASTIKRVGMQLLVQSGHCLAIQLLRYTQFMSLILLEYASFGTSWCLSIGFNCPIKLLHCMCGMVERRTTHSRLSLSLSFGVSACVGQVQMVRLQKLGVRVPRNPIYTHTHIQSRNNGKKPAQTQANKTKQTHSTLPLGCLCFCAMCNNF